MEIPCPSRGDELIKSCSRRTANAADLYAFLEKDDDKGKQAVNAALMALKREGAIRQAGRRQPYTAVEHPQADEAGLTTLTCPSRVASTPPPGCRPSPSPSRA